MSRQHEFTQGARDMLPMLLGAIPFGIIFGSLAGAAGLDPWQTQGMSLLVFAGICWFCAVHRHQSVDRRRRYCRGVADHLRGQPAPCPV